MTTYVIAFRVDASLQIGTGHVMRCLTLACALRDGGADVTFVCRELEGNLNTYIAGEGFRCERLPAPNEPSASPSGPPLATWAEVSWERDSEETSAIVDNLQPDWLILDHYAFDANWQSVVRPKKCRLMVLDDLADRPHDADLLLDQNLGRRSLDYEDLLPVHAERLIGPTYALLRPEFAAFRQQALSARQGRRLRHILVTMGGVDLPDATYSALMALARANLPKYAQITVVMGRQAPALERVRTMAASMPVSTDVRTDVIDMARLMAEADIAVGGVGGTAWERCALGLPTVLVPIADNQWPAAQALSKAGAALLASTEDEDLDTALDQVLNPERARALSQQAVEVCDGTGTARTVRRLLRQPLTLRDARQEDAPSIYNWRYEGDAACYYRSHDIPSHQEHLIWFKRALASGEQSLLIAEVAGQPVGHLRLDPGNRTDVAEVALCIAPDSRGKGDGLRSLLLLSDIAQRQDLACLTAEVHTENDASVRLFKSAGFEIVGQDNEFIAFEKLLGTNRAFLPPRTREEMQV